MSRYLTLASLAWIGSFLFLLGVAGCSNQNGSSADKGTHGKQISVEVTGMSCGVACPPRVREALATLPGVKDVNVNYERKLATITVESGTLDEAVIKTALEKEGFGGKLAKN